MLVTVIDRAEAEGRVQRRRTDAINRQYQTALGSLDPGQSLEICPEEGETIRGIKLRARQAARATGLTIDLGETEAGTVVIWLKEPA